MRMVAPFSLPGRSALGITLMQCMQRTLVVIDGQVFAIPCHAPRGAAITHVFLNIESARHIFGQGCIILPNFILPGADDGEICTGNGGHAIVRHPAHLNLNL